MDQDASPEGLHDLLGNDKIEEFVDPGPGIVKPVHYAVTGEKTGLSLHAHSEYQGLSGSSRTVVDGSDRPCSARDIRSDEDDFILCRADGAVEPPGEQAFDIFYSGQVLPVDGRDQIGIPEHAPGDPGNSPCPGDHIRDPGPDMRPAGVGKRDCQREGFSAGPAGTPTEDFLHR